VTSLAAEIAAAFKASCVDELEALKPGNVHAFATNNRKTLKEFIASADAAAPALAADGAGVGVRIAGAVEATRAVVATNTNLGIILLCAPLAAAAGRRPSDLRGALAAVLDDLDIDDARLTFRAIVMAAPGGLGRAEYYDVFEPATVDLRQAMAAAAGRDRIARQYVTNFADVFDLGEPALLAASTRWSEPKWATLMLHLTFLASFADTHVVRERGPAIAEDVCRTAQEFRTRMECASVPDRLLPDLLAWDSSLKREGINPGTSADLTVATLFVRRLRNILPPTHNND